MPLDLLTPPPAQTPSQRPAGVTPHAPKPAPAAGRGGNLAKIDQNETDGAVDFRSRLQKASDTVPGKPAAKSGSDADSAESADTAESPVAAAGVPAEMAAQAGQVMRHTEQLPSRVAAGAAGVDLPQPDIALSASEGPGAAVVSPGVVLSAQAGRGGQGELSAPIATVPPQPDGEVLPLPGKHLPLVAANAAADVGEDVKPAKPDVPFTKPELPNVQGHAQPALSRARFDMSPNEVAIREHLQSVLGETRGLPVVEGGSDNSPVLLTAGSATTQPASSIAPHRAPPTPIARAPEFTLPVPAGEPGWDMAVGNRLLWMVERNTSAAILRLDPPDIGALEVRVFTEGDKANVSFFAHTGQAREMLESTLPRLREMFAENGMQLVDANVSHDSMGHQPGANPFTVESEGNVGELANSDDVPATDVPLLASSTARGLVDYYI